MARLNFNRRERTALSFLLDGPSALADEAGAQAGIALKDFEGRRAFGLVKVAHERDAILTGKWSVELTDTGLDYARALRAARPATAQPAASAPAVGVAQKAGGK